MIEATQQRAAQTHEEEMSTLHRRIEFETKESIREIKRQTKEMDEGPLPYGADPEALSLKSWTV